MKIYTSCQPGGFSESFYEIVDTIKEVGFDGVFLSTQEGHLEDKQIEYVRKIGLDIETLHLPYNINRKLVDDMLEDNEHVKEDLVIIKESIDLAYKHHISKVVFHSSSGTNPPPFDNVNILYFKELVEYCKDRNIDICFENIRRSDYQEYLLNYFKDYDNVKACFDFGHANGFTKDINSKDYSYAFKRLGCVHMHDNDGTYDYHLIPGMGNIDFVKHINEILKYNDSMNLTLELYFRRAWFYKDDITMKEFYETAYQAISNIRKKVDK